MALMQHTDAHGQNHTASRTELFCIHALLDLIKKSMSHTHPHLIRLGLHTEPQASYNQKFGFISSRFDCPGELTGPLTHDLSLEKVTQTKS